MSIFKRLRKNTAEKQARKLNRELATALPEPVTEKMNVNPFVDLYFQTHAEKYDNQVYTEMWEDYRGRAELGKEKYGTYLMTNNGRHPPFGPFKDAYEEALDGIAYTTQGMLENQKDSPAYRAFNHMREMFMGAAFIAKLNMKVLEELHAKENEGSQSL